MSLLSAQAIAKRYGPRTVLDGVSLTIEPRDRVGLIGLNGAGKSTLIRIMLGTVEPDEGTVMRRRELTIAEVAQEPRLDKTHTIGQAIAEGQQRHATIVRQLTEVEHRLGTLSGSALEVAMTEHATLMETLERAGGYEVGHLADAMLDALGAPPRERVIGSLSLGEQRRVAVAIALLQGADLLVLDEPTNHLDLGAIEWLEAYLADYRGALLLVTHDRYFLDRVTSRIAELDRGKLYTYEGNYTEYMVQKAERAAIESRTEHNRQRDIERELVWVRASAPARTTKQKARLDRFDLLVSNRPTLASGSVTLRLPHPPRLGKTILELHDLTKTLGERTLIRRLNLLLTAGSRLGIVGPNGAGKTTLIRMVLGELQPDSGAVVQGSNTRIVYADQARATLDDNNSVLEEVAQGNDKVFIGDEAVQVQTFLDQLLFDGGTQRTPVGALSGGERSRVALAKSLRNAGNLLILDEPTNDLDLPTLRVLEEALTQYPGCALIVSHDRYFLDRVATAILAFEGDGKIVLYEGTYMAYRGRVERGEAPDLARRPARVQTSRGANKPSVAPVAADSASAELAAPPAPAKKKKRTYKEEQELATMEERILGAESAAAELEAKLNDPAEVRTLGAKLGERVRELEAKKAEIERLYARWAELEAG